MSRRLPHVIDIRLCLSKGFIAFVVAVHLLVLVLIALAQVWVWLQVFAVALAVVSASLLNARIRKWRDIIGLRISNDGVVLVGRRQDTVVKNILGSVETRLFVVLSLTLGVSGSGVAETKQALPIFVDATSREEMLSLRRYLRAS